MLSVVVLFRSAPELAATCLASLKHCQGALAAAGEVEYLFIDDCSAADRAVQPALEQFRRDIAPATVRICRFNRPMHYAHGLAYALSFARGDVLFISHDMELTPACVEALLAAAKLDESIGVIRPTSQHMDWANKLAVAPPPGITALDPLCRFASEVRKHFQDDIVDWPILIGDAMFIKRSVIDRIGTFDPRFVGFMGDIDYGIRVGRAGFRQVIARGAWLSHQGNGTAKSAAAAGGESIEQQGRRMLQLVDAAYAQMRQKWGEANLPPTFRDMRRQHFNHLHAGAEAATNELFQPALELTPEVGHWL